MNKPTVIILGASTNRSKYGNKAVRAYLKQGYDVYPVNPKADEIEGLPTYHRLADIPIDQPDRVSVYLPPNIGLGLLEEIRETKAKEVWFNPGSESPELLSRSEELGLNVITACSIVAVGMRPDDMPDD